MTLRHMLAIVIVLATPGLAGEKAVVRPVWTGSEVNTLGAPSPDGRWLSYVDAKTGNLAVRDLRSGATRMVTRKEASERGQYAYFSVFAPDSEQIAFAWFNEEGFYDLRISSIPKPGEVPHAPTVLYSNPEAGFVQPCAFSPDGGEVLTLFFRKDNISQIALVPSAGGNAKPLRSLNWIYPKRMDFSADGESVVYDNASQSGAYERDVFLLARDGSQETRLVAGPANELFPLWTRQRDGVVFSSDRSGEAGVWWQAIENNAPTGDPRLLADALGRFLLLGVTDSGTIYFGRRQGGSELVRYDLARGKWSPLVADRQIAAIRGTISPDGSTLAYIAPVAGENYGVEGRMARLYALAGGASKDLPVRLAHLEDLVWSPDGTKVLFIGSDRRARNGAFLYDLASGVTRPVAIDPNAGIEGVDASFSPDGKRLWWVRGDHELMRRELSERDDEAVFESTAGTRLLHPRESARNQLLAFGEERANGKTTVRLRDPSTGISRDLFTLPSGKLSGLAWAPDGGELLVETSSSAGLRLWRVARDGQSMKAIARMEHLRAGASFAPDGKSLISAAGVESEEVWVIEDAFREIHR